MVKSFITLAPGLQERPHNDSNTLAYLRQRSFKIDTWNQNVESSSGWVLDEGASLPSNILIGNSAHHPPAVVKPVVDPDLKYANTKTREA